MEERFEQWAILCSFCSGKILPGERAYAIPRTDPDRPPVAYDHYHTWCIPVCHADFQRRVTDPAAYWDPSMIPQHGNALSRKLAAAAMERVLPGLCAFANSEHDPATCRSCSALTDRIFDAWAGFGAHGLPVSLARNLG